MSVKFKNGEIARSVARCDGCGLLWWRGDCRVANNVYILCPECRELLWSERAKAKAARASKGRRNITIGATP